MEDSLSNPEKTQTVKQNAQDAEVAQEYRVAQRESDTDKNNASNNAFHRFVNYATGLTVFPAYINSLCSATLLKGLIFGSNHL
jgi:hypothetical protein